MKTKYSFKIYLNNNTSKVLGGKANTPENLKYDFDGMISWEEYDKVCKMNLTSKEVLSYAKKFYNEKYSNQIVKIEIVNIETNEIVDFIE